MRSEARERYENWVRKLEQFGHRGSGTNNEREAAIYIASELAALGLSPRLEPFAGYRSFGGRLLAPVVVAAGGVALLWSLPALTTILGMIALTSLIVEQTTRGVLLSRLLPRRPSQNVTATLARQASAARVRLVICGHYDTQRTGLLFRDVVWRLLAPFQRRLPAILQSPLLPVVLAMVLQIALGIVGCIYPMWPMLVVLGIGILIVYLCTGMLFAEWMVRPHVPGASDNASGAAAVLALAEQWRADPVDDVEVVFLLTGCEEVSLVGAATWADQHRSELQTVPTIFLNLDGLGFGSPQLLGQEVPLAGLPVPYPPNLIATGLETVRDENPDTTPVTVPGYTDGMAFLARGIPGLTLVGCQPNGRLPHWHLPTDVSERMDFDGAWRGVELASRLARRLVASSTQISA